MSPLITALLEKRGITTEEEKRTFLEPDYLLHTHAPELLSGMDTAVARVLKAMEENERIAIYSDFDCDGIPGAAVLSDLFEKLGYANFEVYLPHRDREGYGFHTEAISQLAERDVQLIITVDVGTTAIEGVRFAKEKGIDTIVTDHHEIPGELPDALVILNPKLAPYPFPHLCGAAVAFKLAQAVLAEGRAQKIERFADIPEGWEKWLLDLVAIATVADMVPLIGENRTLVFWGLQVLRRSQRPGITALCTKLRLKKSELTEETIGFSIAPRINAASRMDEPHLALKLLTTRDADEAEQLAAQLEKLNASRKGVVSAMVREARRKVKDRFNANERVIVLGDPEWKPALLGLAANSIMEDRGGVVCIWGRDSAGRIKGSCRSDGAISVVDLFAKTEGVFSEFGGHAASGGFTVIPEQVHTLHESLSAVAGVMERRDVADTDGTHDALVTLREVSEPLFRDIQTLAPYGLGNPKPIFRVAHTIVTSLRTFGKESNHIELELECRQSGARCRAFDFFRTAEGFSHVPTQGTTVQVLATVERDSYRGGLVLRLVDVLPGA